LDLITLFLNCHNFIIIHMMNQLLDGFTMSYSIFLLNQLFQ
jgi:hypothetical protein